MILHTGFTNIAAFNTLSLTTFTNPLHPHFISLFIMANVPTSGMDVPPALSLDAATLPSSVATPTQPPSDSIAELVQLLRQQIQLQQ